MRRLGPTRRAVSGAEFAKSPSKRYSGKDDAMKDCLSSRESGIEEALYDFFSQDYCAEHFAGHHD